MSPFTTKHSIVSFLILFMSSVFLLGSLFLSRRLANLSHSFIIDSHFFPSFPSFLFALSPPHSLAFATTLPGRSRPRLPHRPSQRPCITPTAPRSTSVPSLSEAYAHTQIFPDSSCLSAICQTDCLFSIPSIFLPLYFCVMLHPPSLAFFVWSTYRRVRFIFSAPNPVSFPPCRIM